MKVSPAKIISASTIREILAEADRRGGFHATRLMKIRALRRIGLDYPTAAFIVEFPDFVDPPS